MSEWFKVADLKSAVCSRIELYDKMWEEQENVLQLINKWKLGERFSANDYRRKSNASSISSI
jgi:hypothetical protein